MRKTSSKPLWKNASRLATVGFRSGLHPINYSTRRWAGHAGLPFCLRQVAIAQSPQVEEYHQDDPIAVSRSRPPEAASPFSPLQWIELIAGYFLPAPGLNRVPE